MWRGSVGLPRWSSSWLSLFQLRQLVRNVSPPSIRRRSKASPGHAVALCPNPSGLRVFTSVARQRAAREADGYGRRNLTTDLANSDRAWWPHVHELWKRQMARKHSIDVVVGSEPAARSGFAVFLRPACGSLTLSRTVMVTVGPPRRGLSALQRVQHASLLHRAARSTAALVHLLKVHSDQRLNSPSKTLTTRNSW